MKWKYRQEISKDNVLKAEFPIIENSKSKTLKKLPEIEAKTKKSKERKMDSVVKKALVKIVWMLFNTLKNWKKFRI